MSSTSHFCVYIRFLKFMLISDPQPSPAILLRHALSIYDIVQNLNSLSSCVRGDPILLSMLCVDHSSLRQLCMQVINVMLHFINVFVDPQHHLNFSSNVLEFCRYYPRGNFTTVYRVWRRLRVPHHGW